MAFTALAAALAGAHQHREVAADGTVQLTCHGVQCFTGAYLAGAVACAACVCVVAVLMVAVDPAAPLQAKWGDIAARLQGACTPSAIMYGPLEVTRPSEGKAGDAL